LFSNASHLKASWTEHRKQDLFSSTPNKFSCL